VDRPAEAGAGSVLTLAAILEAVKDRGLKLLLRPDGTPYLRGDKAQATPLMLEVLKLHRAEVVSYLQQQGSSSVAEPSAAPGKTCREWAWRDGRRHCETPGDEHFGNRDWHPEGAWWWRIQETSEWHLVPQPEESA